MLLAPCLLAGCAVTFKGAIVVAVGRIFDSGASVQSGWIRRGAANAKEVSLAAGSSRREVGGVSRASGCGRNGRRNYQIEWGRTFFEEQDVANGLLVEVNALRRLVVRHFGGGEAVKC